MWTTFGVLSLVLGFILLIAGLGRGVFARSSAPVAWKYAAVMGGLGVVLLVAGLVMLHQGEGQGLQRVPIGAALVLVGFVIMGVGTWLALWAPVAFRNTMGGWKLILIGLAVLVLGIVVMTMRGGADVRTGSHRVRPTSEAAWRGVFSHRVGPIPFGAFAAAVLLATNGLGLRRGLGAKALLGANIFMISVLLLVYALGPRLFPRW